MVDPRIGHSNLDTLSGEQGGTVSMHPWFDPRMGQSNLVIRGYSQGCKGVPCPSMVDPWMDIVT